jgi:small redox-active disulfide protein 2
MKLQVLGTGCAKCTLLSERVAAAAREAGLEDSVEKVTDIQQILAFGVMSTPALAVDGKVLFSGKVPEVAELRGMLTR